MLVCLCDRGIIARHEALFKELFYTIESEKNGEPDWNQIDKKLHSYLQERRLQYKRYLFVICYELFKIRVTGVDVLEARLDIVIFRTLR